MKKRRRKDIFGGRVLESLLKLKEEGTDQRREFRKRRKFKKEEVPKKKKKREKKKRRQDRSQDRSTRGVVNKVVKSCSAMHYCNVALRRCSKTYLLRRVRRVTFFEGRFVPAERKRSMIFEIDYNPFVHS